MRGPWVLRGALTASLLAASALTFAAARERWWPACPRGGFDSATCLPVQSHEHDYLVPTTPWVPVGHAAELAGLSLLALALAALLLPLVLPRVRSLVVTAVIAVLPAAAIGLAGTVTLRAGLTGEPVTGSAALTAAGVVWAVAWPAALLLLACLAPSPDGRVRAVTVASLVALSTPIPVLLMLGPTAAGYVSYDTAPWSEATAAPLLLGAAVAVCAPALPVRRRSRQSAATTVAT